MIRSCYYGYDRPSLLNYCNSTMILKKCVFSAKKNWLTERKEIFDSQLTQEKEKFKKTAENELQQKVEEEREKWRKTTENQLQQKLQEEKEAWQTESEKNLQEKLREERESLRKELEKENQLKVTDNRELWEKEVQEKIQKEKALWEKKAEVFQCDEKFLFHFFYITLIRYSHRTKWSLF